MSKTLKTLLTIVLIAMGAMWLFTVYKSCKGDKDKTELTDTNTNSTSSSDNNDETSGSNKLEDLYEDEDDEGEGESNVDNETGNSDEGDAGTVDEDEDEGDVDSFEYKDEKDVSVAGDGIDRNGGEYLVVAGAFISKSNAKRYQKELSKKGYDSEIRVFIGSDYHSVIIGEFEKRGDAIRTADKIGGEAYAHKKRYPKKRR